MPNHYLVFFCDKLHRNLTCSEGVALEALKVFEEGKINDIKIRNKIKWLEKGHATNK
jgi:hypothetical protein